MVALSAWRGGTLWFNAEKRARMFTQLSQIIRFQITFARSERLFAKVATFLRMQLTLA